MAFAAQVLVGMTVFQTSCMLKVSFHARLNQTFGWGQKMESMSIYDAIFKFTGQQHANPDGESATNRATKTWRQKVCQRHNNQPLNAGVSPQVQKGTVGLNQHFSLHRVSLS
jgi:hypothetical protein